MLAGTRRGCDARAHVQGCAGAGRKRAGRVSRRTERPLCESGDGERACVRAVAIRASSSRQTR